MHNVFPYLLIDMTEVYKLYSANAQLNTSNYVNYKSATRLDIMNHADESKRELVRSLFKVSDTKDTFTVSPFQKIAQSIQHDAVVWGNH